MRTTNMNRTIAMIIRKPLSLCTLFGITLFASGCYGEVDTDPAYYPPASYVVTTEPVYYEGHASYWYGGRWVYRDGPRWNYYRSEPQYLGLRRGYVAQPRRVYERSAPSRGRR
jgi:hypothetical protein